MEKIPDYEPWIQLEPIPINLSPKKSVDSLSGVWNTYDQKFGIAATSASS